MEPDKAPLAILLGVVCLVAAGFLAWYASLATLTLTRQGDGVQALFERKLFGVATVGRQSIAGILDAEVVRTKAGSRSSEHRRLYFHTAAGKQDLGYEQQRFIDSYEALRAFFSAGETSELVLYSTDPSDELRRFLVAQACVLFLAALGVLSISLAIRSFLPDTRAGVGPE